MAWLVALVLALGSAVAPARTVYLQPLATPDGRAPAQVDLDAVVHALEVFYDVPIRVLPVVPLPARAWYPPRRRWRAERLLPFLAGRAPADALRVLGITDADISTTKGRFVDWGVLGLGSLDGTAGVISTFRCHRGARSDGHARERLAKVAVHEIGHTLGLAHCPTPGCLMEDAEGKVATVDGEYDLCERCRAQLRASGHAAAGAPAIPWKK